MRWILQLDRSIGRKNVAARDVENFKSGSHRSNQLRSNYSSHSVTMDTSIIIHTGCGEGCACSRGEARQDESDAETVQVEYRGNIFRARKGSILRSALLRNGASPHNDKAMYVNCR
jgi:hypothetical protein